MIKNKDLKQRIIDISYKKGLSHIGSCLTAIDIIDEIYYNKSPYEKFVLSCGHAGLALYVVLEKYNGDNAEDIYNHHGVHPDRCRTCGIDCSSGSLGHGIGIAVGMALADRTKNVYCLLSDGECAEGSVFEAMRIAEQYKITNLKAYVNVNGYAAYQETGSYWIPINKTQRGEAINSDFTLIKTNMNDYPKWIQGQIAHYKVLSEPEYKEMMEILK